MDRLDAGSRLERGSGYHLAITGQEGGREMLVGCVGLRLDADAAGRQRSATGSGGGSGATASRPRRRRGWRAGRWPISTSTGWRRSVATDNPASAAVLRRIGFREVGRGTEAFLARGGEASGAALRGDAGRPVRPARGRTPAADGGAKPLLLVAACALIDADGRVLLARRPEGKTMAGLWEFPGGKLHAGRDARGRR